MSSAPVTERMLPRTTVSAIAERIRDDILSAAYAPGREDPTGERRGHDPTE